MLKDKDYKLMVNGKEVPFDDYEFVKTEERKYLDAIELFDSELVDAQEEVEELTQDILDYIENDARVTTLSAVTFKAVEIDKIVGEIVEAVREVIHVASVMAQTLGPLEGFVDKAHEKFAELIYYRLAERFGSKNVTRETLRDNLSAVEGLVADFPGYAWEKFVEEYLE